MKYGHRCHGRRLRRRSGCHKASVRSALNEMYFGCRDSDRRPVCDRAFYADAEPGEGAKSLARQVFTLCFYIVYGSVVVIVSRILFWR